MSQANRLSSRASARPDTSEVQRAKSPMSEGRRGSGSSGQGGKGSSRTSSGKNKKTERNTEQRRAMTAPTSPDMMLGGRFYGHVMEMDELRTRQVSTRSSSSTRSAGHATSGLVQSVFSSPTAPRARQILRRGEGSRGRPRQEIRRRVGSPTKSVKEKKKILEETWEVELKRRGKNQRASEHRTSRTTTRPALTAAGKAYLHDLAVDRVKSRYLHGPKSSVKTMRSRMLAQIGV